jgi:hypothetical protein
MESVKPVCPPKLGSMLSGFSFSCISNMAFQLYGIYVYLSVFSAYHYKTEHILSSNFPEQK